MKKFLLLLLLFPALSFSQTLTGKWASKEDQKQIAEFKADGTMAFFGVEMPESMAGAVIKYSQVVEDGKKYIICDVYVAGEKMDTQKNVYKVEGDTLTIFSDPDEIANGKEPEDVFYRVK